MDFCSSLPLVVVILEPQLVFLALKCPPAKKRLPGVFKRLVLSVCLLLYLGGQYITVMVGSPKLSSMVTLVSCILLRLYLARS
jgi:hypothetical protein